MARKRLSLVTCSDFILTEELMEEAYLPYPRKGEGKKRGMIRMTEIITTKEKYERFKQAVVNYAERCKQLRTERQYMKHWCTFVNNWEDYENAEDLGLKQSSPFEVF